MSQNRYDVVPDGTALASVGDVAPPTAKEDQRGIF
jgi:hypothetical protein